MNGTLFCFGLGYTACALARALATEGWRVGGTCRDPARAEALRGEGIEAHPFDGAEPLDPAVFAGADHLLSSVPPGPGGDPVLRHHAADIAAMAGLRWIGYLSTTGVYGTRDGGWVDEGSAREPTGQRGARRVAAEDGWLELWTLYGRPVHLFRLAGIYGPGRSALDALREGRARRIDKPGQVFSRIHRDDIVQVLRASIAKPDPGAAYNVCDDAPAAPSEVVEYAAALLGIEPPPPVPIEEAELSPMARSFFDDNKRVRNERIKTELGVRLRYPGYRAGLDAIFRSEPGR